MNLRRNPFGEPAREDRAPLAVADVEDLSAQLGARARQGVPRESVARPRRRARRPRPLAVQFVGSPGRGKSTHLLAVHARLPGAVLVRWTPEGWPGVPSQLPAGEPLLLDDVYMLSPGQRVRIWRKRRTLAIAARGDLGAELRLFGFEVLTVRVAEALTDRRLRHIFERRIEWARRGPGPVPELDGPLVRSLRRRYGTDVRAMERHLYDRVQALEQGDDG